MDPTQHPILSIFEDDTHIDMKAPFNDIDLLRFNKIIINMVLEHFNEDFNLFEVIRSNLRSIVDKMNERRDNETKNSDGSNEQLDHNKLYCVNNKHLINFDEAYEYKCEDLIEFLNTKWRVNKDKVQYNEEDLISKELKTNKRKIDEVEGNKDDEHTEEPQKEESTEEARAVDEVRTFRSGRKVARTAASGKTEDDEKPISSADEAQVENIDINDKPAKKTAKDIEPSVKRTLRRGRTRGTIVDDDVPEPDTKETTPPQRTRRTLRSRK
ncbi:uncharacterized protein HGUI_02379 [Hanseniaspora guilliermondii]|uniref:Uncharacterized protein n=1 Tax=Hanseniaspora guilliermondii TaxID=56406 RepID=A0A1L0B559_9ASCO|nr:uncharacterized protein HGUI_02379 [Hanseniaspora guilliermondii]